MMRRPLLYGAAFLVLGVLIVEWVGVVGCVAGFVLLLLCYGWAHRGSMKKTILLCVVFFTAGSVSSIVQNQWEHPFETREGESVELQGQVLAVKQYEEEDGALRKTSLTIKTKTGSNLEKVLVNVYGKDMVDARPGDVVGLAGTVVLPAEQRNPGCFDYRRYLHAKGIYGMVTCRELTVIQRGMGIRPYLYELKSRFCADLEQKTSRETAGVLQGILFGDKSGILEEVLSEFQKNGTAHILAVSGLHVGMVYAFLAFLWPWKKGRLYFLFISGVLIGYCILSELSPSVLRASAMVILHLLSRLSNRKYDLSSSAFLVAIFFVLKNPLCIYDTSFQMSFLAVLSMSLMMPYVKRVHDGVVTGSVAVQLGLMPYMSSVFNYCAPFAFLINLPVIAVTSLLVPTGLALLAAEQFGMEIPSLAGAVLDGMTEVLIRFNGETCMEGVTVFSCRSMPGWMLAGVYLSMLLVLSENGRLLLLRHGKQAFIILAMVVLAASATFGMVTRTGFEKTDLVFVDVGQGDCVHVKTPEGRNYLFDGGGKEDLNLGKTVLRPYLLKNGVKRIDGAIVSHLHTDHYKGITELCKEGMVRDLFVYEANRVNEERILAETGLSQEHIHYLRAGMRLALGKDTSAEILWPARHSQREYERITSDEEEENSISLVTKISVDGVSVLTTGDIDETCEKDLVKTCGRKLDADILKVAHHGSKYSSSPEFLQAVTPVLSVIQVGKNTYGHPTAEALERLETAGSAIYRNDLSGAVGVEIHQGSVQKIQTVNP